MPTIKLCDGALSLLSWIQKVSGRNSKTVFLIRRPYSEHALDLVEAGLLRASTVEGFVVTEAGEKYIAKSDLERAVMDANLNNG